MKKDNPKRRKSKDNPYQIVKMDDKYLLLFADGQGCSHRLEIEKKLFEVFDEFELEDLSVLNEFDRHVEHSELSDASLFRRALYPQPDIDEIVTMMEQSRMLRQAIAELPEVQRRRFLLYYEHDLTYEQIAELEDRTAMPVKRSIDRAMEAIKNIFKNRGYF